MHDLPATNPSASMSEFCSPATPASARLRRGAITSASTMSHAARAALATQRGPRAMTLAARPLALRSADAQEPLAPAPSPRQPRPTQRRQCTPRRARSEPLRQVASEPLPQSRGTTPAAQSARHRPAARPPRSHAVGSERARNDGGHRQGVWRRHDRERGPRWLARRHPSGSTPTTFGRCRTNFRSLANPHRAAGSAGGEPPARPSPD